MTREEAIKVLSSYDVNGVWADVNGKPYNAEEQAEAFDMAIEALQTPPISQRSMYQAGYRQAQEDRPRGDLISRADAIEAIEETDWYHQNRNKDMVSGANSDEHQAWYKADDVYKALEAVPSVNRPKDGDLISRADAIEALGEEPPVWCDEEYEIAERDQWRADIEAIESVPSADRPRGEWLDENGTYYANCSKCGYQMDTHVERGYFRYCPNCGADMRGGEDK